MGIVMAPVKLSCNRVRKIFTSASSETLALDETTLDIRAGEFLCLLGPSGCGKTTILNLLAGFEQPTSGTLRLNAQAIDGPGMDRGVIFQEHALFPWLTVGDNVASGKRVRAKPAAERSEIVRHYLAMIGLSGFEHHYPRQLSGGMRQRVAIARGLANEPEVLLMDEPFAALDAISRSLLQVELVRIWELTRKTIVFVTHNIEEAVLLADRVAIMTARPGRVREIVEIDLARPRDINGVEFNAIEKRLRELVFEQHAVADREPDEIGTTELQPMIPTQSIPNSQRPKSTQMRAASAPR
jgi:ABC-type nitrate/sulfonate/bicarbonate transport system ATPase subunit